MDCVGSDVDNQAGLFLVPIEIAVDFVEISEEGVNADQHLTDLIAFEELF